MPKVKIARDNCTDNAKKMATRSRDKMKLEIQKKFSSAVMPKGKRIIQMPKAKSLTSVGQRKQKDVDVQGINKENKKRANNAAENINKDGFTDYNKTVKQSTKQKGMVIYIYEDSEDSDDDDDDDGKDSKDNNDSNSTDDYEPDTEDEEEYRSRSYYW